MFRFSKLFHPNIWLFLILPVIISGLMYLVFRTEQTVVYQIVSALNLKGVFAPLRFYFQTNLNHIPNWLVFSFPGGLWLFAFLNAVSILWKGVVFRKAVYAFLFPVVIVVGLEFLQWLNITDGRFDWVDLIFYALAIISSLLIFWVRFEKQEAMCISRFQKTMIFSVFSFAIFLADVW